MAAYTSLLLGIALCAATVYSLKCYTCDSQFNANCLKETKCRSNATSCQTSVESGVGYTFTIKTCEESCTPVTYNMAGFSTSISCCGTDLCNTSGGASIVSSYTAIVLALGSVLKSSVL